MRRNRIARWLALTSLAVFVGTSAAAADDRANPHIVPSVNSDDFSTITQTQVTIGPCATIELVQAKGFMATIMSGAISAGINLIGDILKNAAQDQVWVSNANRNVDNIGLVGQCIEVARGTFSTRPFNPNDAAYQKISSQTTKWFPGATQNNVIERLWGNQLWLVRQPEFFFEGIFLASADGKAIRLVPVYALLHQSASDSRSPFVSLAFSFPKIGEHADAPNCPAATIVLGKMVENRPLVLNNIRKPGENPYESSWFSLTNFDSKQPHIINAVETETRPGSKFAQFLLNVFNQPGVKEALNTQAQILLIPSVAKAARNEAAATADAVLNDFDSKLAASLSSLDVCVATPNVDSATQARASLRAYMDVARSLDRPDVKAIQGAVDGIRLTADPDTIRKGCADAQAFLRKSQ